MKGFLSRLVHTLRFAKKVSAEEYNLYLKLFLLGLLVVGGIGFLVKVLAFILQLGR